MPVPVNQEALTTFVAGTPQPMALRQQPQPGNQQINGENKSKWSGFLQDPRVKAGLLQAAVNLLAGQNIGQAIGGGLAATGRAGTIEKQQAAEALAQQMALEKHSLAMAKGVKGLRSGSRGKGSSKSSKLLKKYMKGISDYQKALADNAFPGQDINLLTPIEIEYVANNAAEMESNNIDPLIINSMVEYAMNNDNLSILPRLVQEAIKEKETEANGE